MSREDPAAEGHNTGEPQKGSLLEHPIILPGRSMLIAL